jgi:hypothetical protein
MHSCALYCACRPGAVVLKPVKTVTDICTGVAEQSCTGMHRLHSNVTVSLGKDRPVERKSTAMFDT